jgi:hypothetical protein
VTGSAADAIDRANAATAFVVAVDLPSGVSGRTGRPLGPAIRADLTVTFFRLKPGHLLEPGAQPLRRDGARRHRHSRSGFWRRSAAGPSATRPPHGCAIFRSRTATRTNMRAAMSASSPEAPRPRVRRGSRRWPPRVRGAGAVTVLSPSSALQVNAMHLTSIMLRRTDTPDEALAFARERRLAAAVIGPGFGTGRRCAGFVGALAGLAGEGALRLVLDADALTSFEEEPQALFRLLERAEPGGRTAGGC